MNAEATPTSISTNGKTWIKKRAANLGGACYLIGNIGQLADGAYSGNFDKICSGGSLIAASAGFTLAGRNNAIFAACSALGGVGVYFATREMVFQQHDAASAIGLSLCAASATFGTLSTPLAEKFSAAKNALTRRVLGSPRKMMAGFSALSKASLLTSAIANQQWKWAGVLTLWAVGDGFMALSNARKSATLPTPSP